MRELKLNPDYNAANEQELLIEGVPAQSYGLTNKGELDNRGNYFTPDEIINYLGFGRAQVIACLIIGFSYLGTFTFFESQPFLNSRLYVDMQLSPKQEAMLAAAVMAGSVFAHLPVGIIADQLGRKSALILFGCFMIGWNLLTCLLDNYVWILFCRFMLFLGRGASAISNVYIREFLPSENVWIGSLIGEQIAAIFLGNSFPIFAGYFVLTYKNTSWKYYLLFVSIPMFVSILLTTFFLHETPEFLQSRGKEDAALNVIKNIAEQNQKSLPNNFKLSLKQHRYKEISQNSSTVQNEEPYLKMLLSVLTNWSFLRHSILLTLIGVAGKIVNDVFNYILNDILFVQGQAYDYCHGTQLKSYYLSKPDYIKLLMAQVLSLVPVIVMIPIQKFEISVKVQSLVCLLGSIVLVCLLYLCPQVNLALAILSIVRVLMQIIRISSLIALIQLDVPVKVRGVFLDICISVRNLFVPVYAFLEQLLSKESQHYVTTITLGFIIMSWVAAVLLSRNHNPIRTDEQSNKN
ncbi:uncharacterized protein LOC142358463 isoform X1 [Convolutriloba macropyga]|uniref:uncharacterized protein LOC142358463 isoform X1 n=1 Tax=Convolutriloba macropyga TaxID=536237 RepID=UPI003F51CC09